MLSFLRNIWNYIFSKRKSVDNPKYLKLNDYKNNNINIFKLYLSTYSKKKTTKLYENTYNYEIFTPDKIHNIPELNYGRNTRTLFI